MDVSAVKRNPAAAAASADLALTAVLKAALAHACGTIAPSWPLDQAVAVNPHWRRLGAPIRHVAARLAVLGDFRVFPQRSYIRDAWIGKRITRADLDAALALHVEGGRVDVQECIAALDVPVLFRREPLLADVLDGEVAANRHWPWRDAIVFQLSQTCAAYFDRHQADWRAAGSRSLYGFWRETIEGDRGVGSMLGLRRLSGQLRKVPETPEDAARWAMARVGLPQSVWNDYLEALLLSINGWASWCAYVHWQNLPAGKDDPRLQELLVCRLTWEALVANCVPAATRRAGVAALRANWQEFPARVAEAEAALAVDEIWQQALECSYLRGLAGRVRSSTAPVEPGASDVQAPEVQAVFCIDTRSEAMRRALEALSNAVETRAFAGFFGLPIAYTPLDTDIHRPQLPGLAYPSVNVADTILPVPQPQPDERLQEPARRARRQRLGGLDQWLATVRWPSSTFSFVEAAGVGYLGKIAHWIRPPAGPRVSDDRLGIAAHDTAVCRPVITGLDVAGKVELAAGVLHTMGLNDRLAPLVVLCGHAGHSTNNAHASTLDCGACYGRPGEANARALAGLLNDPQVRAGLAGKGLHVPATTVFMATLHNTTTDEVTGFDLDLLPPAARTAWTRMAALFDRAGQRIRRERAAALWMDDTQGDAALLTAFRRRANDGSQTRPEWGLTRNAAFIIGPRARTRGRVLPRCYLHDYDARLDVDGSVLEKLMMGPMLVCHWLSWQYHASTCDPLHYGSGNKVLHNVVDGHVGVFEGNGGDLRIGLPKQSLHNGAGWYHEPVRLTTIIDAPAAMIEHIIAAHGVLGQILDHGWMLLWRYDGQALQRYDHGRWLPVGL
ncbi:MAG: DUF2309 domain-containing protein [Nevskiaceae bacterium]|nr:MAG: DUF2309 domain-containing protein [Nevskiaceae bacterium]TBR74742.1 MAG: DUF2309 domain-containing protein [Nevskiaceae bacterium]